MRRAQKLRAACAMLFEPDSDVVGDADIQRAMAGVGEDIDVVDARVGHRDDPQNRRAVVMDPGLRRDDG